MKLVLPLAPAPPRGSGLETSLDASSSLTFSPFEMKAFGGFYYEAKKKVMWHWTNVSSTWNSMLPIMASLYMLIKWAEGRMEQEHLSHRD